MKILSYARQRKSQRSFWLDRPFGFQSKPGVVDLKCNRLPYHSSAICMEECRCLDDVSLRIQDTYLQPCCADTRTHACMHVLLGWAEMHFIPAWRDACAAVVRTASSDGLSFHAVDYLAGSSLLRVCHLRSLHYLPRFPRIAKPIEHLPRNSYIYNMADPISLTAAAAGFVGLAGQLAHGVIKLKEIYTTIKDAPRDVTDLCTKMESLQGILEEVGVQVQELSCGNIKIDTRTLRNVITQCETSRYRVETHVKQLGESFRGNRAAAARYVFKKKEVQEMLSDLEQCKSSLIIARQSIDGYVGTLSVSGTCLLTCVAQSRLTVTKRFSISIRRCRATTIRFYNRRLGLRQLCK